MVFKRIGGFLLIVGLLASAPVLAEEPGNQDWPAQDWAPQADRQPPAPATSEIEEPIPVESDAEKVVAPQSESGQATVPQGNTRPATLPGSAIEEPVPMQPGATQTPVPRSIPHQGAIPQPDSATISQSSSEQVRGFEPSETVSVPDSNGKIFYKNKLELGLEAGVLPINTPMLVGPLFGYSFHRPHKRWVAFYTLVPAIATLRWQLYNPTGPSFLRGNTEFTFGGTYTAITEGRESLFTGPMTGVRYNFIQPNWKLVPFADLRFGLGYTDANGPYEVKHHLRDDGQGQDFTFTFVMSAGVRYSFSPRYSASLGFMAMHISNLYMSEPKYTNHGVNVVGPMLGFNVGLNDLFRKTWE